MSSVSPRTLPLSRWRPVNCADVLTDPRVLDLDHASRWVMMSLWLVTDDAGRFSGNLRALAQQIGWLDGIKRLEKMIAKFAAVGLVEVYEVGGEKYGQVPDWAGKVGLNKYRDPHYPAPEAESRLTPSLDCSLPPSLTPRRVEGRIIEAKKTGRGVGSAGAHEMAQPPPPRPMDQGKVGQVAEDVVWPSAKVAMAVRQWRGHLERYQAGQKGIPEVTDLNLSSLVECYGAEVFIAAALRHGADDARWWRRPWAGLKAACEFAKADAPAEAVTGADIEPAQVVRPVVETEAASPIVGPMLAGWAEALTALEASGVTRSDRMTWLEPLRPVVLDGRIWLVAPDSSHATMVRELFGPALNGLGLGQMTIVEDDARQVA